MFLYFIFTAPWLVVIFSCDVSLSYSPISFLRALAMWFSQRSHAHLNHFEVLHLKLTLLSSVFLDAYFGR